MSEINEAVEYFKKKPVYEKLFNEFKKKYESHGKIGGIAVLTGLSTGDKEDVSGFLMKDFTSEEEVRVSAKLFEKALLKSRFSSLTTLDIITHYFGIKLRTNKEKSEENEGKRAEYLAELTGYTDKAYIKEWLTGVFCTGADGAVVIKQFLCCLTFREVKRKNFLLCLPHKLPEIRIFLMITPWQGIFLQHFLEIIFASDMRIIYQKLRTEVMCCLRQDL